MCLALIGSLSIYSESDCFLPCPGSSNKQAYRQIRAHSQSLQGHRLSSSIIDSVEQELERAVRLSAKRYLRTEEKYPSLSDSCLGDDHSILKILLSPGPSASERS